jgi:hypothetical protein
VVKHRPHPTGLPKGSCVHYLDCSRSTCLFQITQPYRGMGKCCRFVCPDQPVGAWLTISPLAVTLGFVTLPPLYWLLLAIMLVCYVILTQLVKTWFYHRFGE